MPHTEDTVPGVEDKRQPQYFSAEPVVASKRATVELHLPDQHLTLLTDTGVFSGSRVDPGTKLLLLEAAKPTDSDKHVLDLGCGYGAIAVTAALRAASATVWAVDVNERALALCAENAATHKVAVHTSLADGVPDDVRFDLIVSNPPIRIGKQQLHQLLATWLDRLSPTGRAELVVQKHLGSDSLAKWLTGQGWETERLVSRSGYRILRVRPRPSGSDT